MVKHLLLLLGLPEDSTITEIKKRYARLLERLSQRDSAAPEVVDELQPARQRLSESFEHWKKVGALDQCSYTAILTATPKLGQVLVASDRLTINELVTVLKLQRSARGQRFGELLVSNGYISSVELDHFLQLQRIIELPLDHPERWGQRLVDLGLLCNDQLNVALIDHRRTGNSLRAAIIDRGWLTSAILDRIF
ncbi:MAG: hypothetical protein SGJ27_15575 [Candidatus Melainabacteria bacterium]|nr:hypothetical protein [Candidatus Melainabacteria bacterium]